MAEKERTKFKTKFAKRNKAKSSKFSTGYQALVLKCKATLMNLLIILRLHKKEAIPCGTHSRGNAARILQLNKISVYFVD